MDDDYLAIGSWHGLLVGAIVLLGGWIYCACEYGFLLGFGLGWLPSGTLGIIVYFLCMWLWPLLDILILIVIYLAFANNTEHKAEEKTSAPTSAIVEHAPSSPETNNPIPQQRVGISPQVLASCVMLASKTFQVPPQALIGIMQVEGGHIGQTINNSDGSMRFGPMLISSHWIPELEKIWHTDYNTTLVRVRDDGCVNVHVAAWILRQRINETGNLYKGIAAYHSHNPTRGNNYLHKVIVSLQRMGYIASDSQYSNSSTLTNIPPSQDVASSAQQPKYNATQTTKPPTINCTPDGCTEE
jgi:hypothetical protein